MSDHESGAASFCSLCSNVFGDHAAVRSLSVRGGKAYLCDDCLGGAVTLAFNLDMKKAGNRVIFPGGK